MSFNMELRKDGECVNIKFYGQIDSRSAKRARDNVFAGLDAGGRKRILIDLSRVVRIPSTLFQYQLILEIQSKSTPDTRVALLVNEKLLDDAYFIETVSLNHGLILRPFLKKEEAIAWLCKGSERETNSSGYYFSKEYYMNG